MSSPPLTTTSAPSISASPLQHIPPADLNLTPDVELQTPFSFQFADADETGHHEFEIVQTRCDVSQQSYAPYRNSTNTVIWQRRREQNRKAQRAYRARKEAQLKAASTTLFEKQTQLQSLDNHNKALMETIEQLKATITRLEIENQALKANSPSMGGFDETSFWVAEPVTTASCASAVEVLWELHANLTRP